MKDNFFNTMINNFWQANVMEYVTYLQENPLRLIPFCLDLTIVIFLAYQIIKITKKELSY